MAADDSGDHSVYHGADDNDTTYDSEGCYYTGNGDVVDGAMRVMLPSMLAVAG